MKLGILRSYAERMVIIQQTGSGDPLEFEVIVREDSGETRHHVTMKWATYENLSGGKFSPEECIRAAFSFLLDRERKESILSRFDVTVIGRYFPGFERELPRYVSGPK